MVNLFCRRQPDNDAIEQLDYVGLLQVWLLEFPDELRLVRGRVPATWAPGPGKQAPGPGSQVLPGRRVPAS